MKFKSLRSGIALLALAASLYPLHAADNTKNTAKPAAIGVYDSRAVAYAYFSSPEFQKQNTARIDAAKAAKQAGDTVLFEARSKSLREAQKLIHRQVFSTEPVDEILATLKDRLPAIQTEAGVSKLVSKWDTKSLTPGVPQVDVTDLLVREFKLGEKQLRMIESIKSKKPLPLGQCDDD